MRDIRKSEIIELQFQGRVLNWLKEIIAKEKLHFDLWR
jgi:hypothetical protein